MNTPHSSSIRARLVATLGLWLSSACGNSGGDDGGGRAGAPPGSAGALAAGGAPAASGATSAGGAQPGAGSTAAGGSTASGGSTANGGSTASGGSTANGGSTPSGGTTAGGGTTASGGSTASGGASGSTNHDLCKPIGWATRSGRTGSAVSVTGGGTTPAIVVNTFADLKKYAADGEARVIHVDGTLGAGWSGSSGDRLEIKSNKTIIGLRAGTQLKAAIHISGASNVILRNLVVRGPGSNEDQAWDNLNIEGAPLFLMDYAEHLASAMGERSRREDQCAGEDA